MCGNVLRWQASACFEARSKPYHGDKAELAWKKKPSSHTGKKAGLAKIPDDLVV